MKIVKICSVVLLTTILFVSCGKKNEEKEDAANEIIVESVESEEGLNEQDEDLLTEEDEDVEESEEAVAEAEPSSDWDKILADYEDMVDDYVDIVTKASKGDASAISDMTSMLQKAQDLSEQLSNAKGDLTVAQLNQYNKLAQKMTTAAAKAAKVAAKSAEKVLENADDMADAAADALDKLDGFGL